MKTKTEIVEQSTTKAPSSENATAYVPVVREDLLAALEGATNERATQILDGVTAAGKNSVLYVQREHLLEALADEPAVV